MGKRIGANDGLVWLYDKAGNSGNQTRCVHDLGGINARGEREGIVTGVDRHHDFFECGVTGTFAEAIDRAFDLTRPCIDRRDRVGNRHAQIVVAVNRQDRLVDVRHAVKQHGHQFGIFGRRGVSNRIGDVDGGRTGINGRFDATAQEVMFGTRTVFCRPFNIVGELARQCHTFNHLFQNAFRFHLQFVFHMQRACGDEGVDTLVLSRFQCLCRAFDVALGGTCQRTDGRSFDLLGDFMDGLEVAVRCDGKACFDDINLQFRQCVRHAQLFIKRHRCTRGLFPITQSGVENDDAIVVCTSHYLVS